MIARSFSIFCSIVCASALTGLCPAQTQASMATAAAISLQDAIARAKQYSGQIQSANLAIAQAQEDTKQARAARLPSVNALNQYINTQGNGTPSGVFVANDGVHVYNEQAVIHEELLSFIRHGEVNRALAAEAHARSKADVAARGLVATVVQDYYAIVSAQRRFNNLQISVQESARFVEITQQQEKGGEGAHADVIRAQIDLQQRQRDASEAQYAVAKAKIALGVLIFPNFSADFSVIDDLQTQLPLLPVEEARTQAAEASPDLKAATEGIQEAGFEAAIARYQYLPSLSLDVFYGIDANQFAITSHNTQDTGRSTLPNYQVSSRNNLGYVAQATLNIPVWNWGATRSRVKQAEMKRDQAQIELTLAQRELQGTVAAAYAEAQAAQAQLASLRSSTDLAVENLRLTLLRYSAGESTALEVVDAQMTLTGARNAYDDGLARYRIAVANLQILTGTL